MDTPARGYARAVIARGMIHGRFQPPHLGHLEYLTAVAERCGELWIGVTNPDRREMVPEADDPARHLPESNPLSYPERMVMLSAAAGEAGVRGVRIVPFPISRPELWPDYVPPDAVHFVRLFSPWGRAKLARLGAHGHRVEVLDAPDGKTVSGEAVRAAIRGGGEWRSMVPPAVADLIEGLPEGHALAPRRPL